MAKNASFRRTFVGKTLSAVTMENNRALTSNFLQVELSQPRPARLLTDLQIGATSETGLLEYNPLQVLTLI